MTASSASSTISGAVPRYATEPTAGRRSVGPEMLAVMRRLGWEPMPWQTDWLGVLGELVRDEETGIWVPAFPEGFATMPRQNGKTSMAESWMWHRLLMWVAWDAKPQAVSWTAQNGAEARRKFRNERIPAWRRSSLWRHVDKARYAADDTGVSMKNGSVLSISNNAAGSGHSAVVDASFFDEIWGDKDHRREQAFVPAMATRHDRQKLLCSTAGDASSVLFPHKQAAGRAAVVEGRTEGIAYLEYSADKTAPGYDPESPATWRTCMPALGFTITERTVRQAWDEMVNKSDGEGVAEFERAWLNVPKSDAADQAIPDVVWQACRSDDAHPRNGLTYAVEVSADFRHGAIVAADSDGQAAMVFPDPARWSTHGMPEVSISELVDAVLERAERWRVPVVVNTSGPSRMLVEHLEMRDVDVEKVDADKWRAACGWLFAQVADRLLAVRGHPGLDAAIRGGMKRPSADSWVWDRRTVDADVTPLAALTLASWHAASHQQMKPFFA